MPDTSDIYGRGVWLYREAGWRGVLPTFAKAKAPIPAGYTGHDGKWPTDEETKALAAKWPADSNIVLRVEYGIIGLDIDAYGAKTGGRTLTEGQTRWSPLPPTCRSSARPDDPVSGIRLFRVPLGVKFKGVAKFPDLNIGDIETIQIHHRFVACWPSIHHTGRQYRWFDPDGQMIPEGTVPRVEDITAELPQEWIDGLSVKARDDFFDRTGPDHHNHAQREKVNEALYQKLIGLDDDAGMDAVVAHRLDQALTDLGSGSRYDTTRDHVAALMRFRAIGRTGVPRALEQLYQAYVMTVIDSRPTLVAETEFLRFTAGAAALVAATMSPRGDLLDTTEEPFILAWYPWVAKALKTVTGDLPGDTMRVVGACQRGGLNLAQTRWAVNSRKDLADHHAERDDDDVARCWQRCVESKKTDTGEEPQ